MTGTCGSPAPEAGWRPIASGTHPQCIDCLHHLFTDFTLVNSMLWDMHVLDFGVDVNGLSVGVCTLLGKVVRCYAPACAHFKATPMQDTEGV